MHIVSLFSGCGGLDLGFINAGHKIIWANDFDADAVASYKTNIGDHIILGDIRQIESAAIPDCDMVIGGFPCQGFSLANLKRTESDERNKLYLEFYRVIRDKKPKYFVAENVKGILSLGKGAVLNLIVEDFEEAGYNVTYKLINCADYGVPQIRQRVIFIGIRKDIDEVIEFPEPSHDEKEDSELLKWVSMKDALLHIPEPDENTTIPNHVYSAYKVFSNKNFTGHRVVDPDKPSPTILARGNGGGGVVVIHHPNNHRRLSVREAATIQTFPIDFIFIGSKTSCYRQIGNAVPPLFAEKLAHQFSTSKKSLVATGGKR
ncbi:DNA (cytosine-5)-methyltransferase 1 [Paenibacillus turicensis]|uniref:Cytosine-specific methyltransferase n=1 Tax=Paenibacillus turicensis TaxID=160487 RepID=A0ABS4FUU7_9BACL|nr:DNA cytosine methyltransferase [Paenibacillus turicensis]MBP1906310.1 DNA (cytosine-5)-methyltransferase 1 [Paenibacillus turicensis]